MFDLLSICKKSSLFDLLFCLTSIGITYVTVISGAMSLPYHIVVAMIFLTIIIILFKERSSLSHRAIGLLLISFIWVLSSFIKHAIFDEGLSLSSITSYLSPLLVLMIVLVLGGKPPSQIKLGIQISAIFHLALLVFLINATFLHLPSERLAIVNLGVVPLAEVATATLILAVLTKNNFLILIGSVIVFKVLILTDMRSTMVVCFFLISFHYHTILFKFIQRKLELVFLFFCCVFLVLMYNVDKVTVFVTQVLKLNDPHRGLQSGLSGRTEGIISGLDHLSDSPIWGVGPLVEGVEGIHLGFLKIAVEFGLPFLFIYLVFVMYGVYQLYRSKRYDFVVIASMYILFLLTSPRTINLQIFPLVSIYLIAVGFNSRRSTISEFKQSLQ